MLSTVSCLDEENQAELGVRSLTPSTAGFKTHPSEQAGMVGRCEEDQGICECSRLLQLQPEA